MTNGQRFVAALILGIVCGVTVMLLTAGDDLGIATGAIIAQIVWWHGSGPS